MRVSDFSVVIAQGIEKQTGYVEMIHGTQYHVRLINHASERCDAKVVIDGKHIGTWRVNSKSSIDLERPADDDGKFTFYRCGSKEAYNSDIEPADDTGLIQVTFMPEHKSYQDECIRNMKDTDMMLDYDLCDMSYAPGGTGLSGKSDQAFETVAPLEYDDEQFTIINLRLVAKTDTARPLNPLRNNVPPAVY